MITCPKCAKENQDHYKFCLGCGAELPRTSGAPKPFAPNTPPHGVSTGDAQAHAGNASQGVPNTAPVQHAPAAAPVAASAAAASNAVTCPQCGHANPAANRFCASCGYNLAAIAAAPAAAASAPTPVASAEGKPVRLTALRADGSEAGHFPMPDAASVTVGRDTGSIFAGDSYLSPRHATFVRQGGGLYIKDESSLNGVYLKLTPNEPWTLHFGDIFRIGQEIVRFEELKPHGKSADGVERFGSPAKGYIGRLALVIGRDTTGNAFPIPERGVHLGRERGDILFSEDGYVSGLHCRVAPGPDGHVQLTDVGSSNGTFIRLRKEHPLSPGDILLMGQQLFRVDF